MPKASKVLKDSVITFRVPTKLIGFIDRASDRREMSRSELIRQAIERVVLDEQRLFVRKRAWRRLSIVRRCTICRAFVRSGFTCATCRTTPWDSIVVNGVVVSIPSMTPIPVTTRPDVRDSRWQIAEQVVLDGLSPLVATVYECLTSNDAYEPTNLDEVRDLFVLAASINK